MGTVRPSLPPKPVLDIGLPFTLILDIIGVPISSLAITLIFNPLALIGIAVGVHHASEPLAFAGRPIPFIDSPIERIGGTVSLLLSPTPLAFIDDSVTELLDI
jgi:hypothetical protein